MYERKLTTTPMTITEPPLQAPQPQDSSGKTPAHPQRGQRRPGFVGNGLKALIRRLHFYAGMFIGPFLLVAALTGAAYALAPTMENIAYKELLTVQPTDHPVALDEQIANAHAEHPNMEIAQVWPADEPDESTRVLLADESLEGGRLRSIFIDPGTGDVIGDEPTYSGLGELPLRKFISELHRDLHLGKVGELYSELAASWMWFVALGGLLLWWGRVGGKRLFSGLKFREDAITRGGQSTPRRTRNWFINLHGVAGTWLLIAMLGLSVTGITWSGFAGQNVKSLVASVNWEPRTINTELSSTTGEDAVNGAQDEHGEHGGHGGHSSAGAEATTSAESLAAERVAEQATTVLGTARAEGLIGPLRLYPPATDSEAWQVSERWVPWRVTSDAISVDGATGETVDRLPFAELPLFSKLTSWGIYLHMGIMFGLPLQLVLFLTALGIAALVVLGYIAWWKRRPTRAGIAGVPGTVKPLTAGEWLIVLVFLVTIGAFLPLLGLSLVAMLVVDRLLAARVRSGADFRRVQGSGSVNT